ncbi:MAG: 50S ribosomal protein L31e [Candidatus Atabeyarchaeum deiterrae]
MASERVNRGGKAESSKKETKVKPEPAEKEIKAKTELAEEERKKPTEAAPLEERVYTVPLSKTRYVPYYKRASKAILLLRGFFTRHMKAERVIFSKELNEAIWVNGIRNPPRKVRVRATKDDEGNVTLYIAE